MTKHTDSSRSTDSGVSGNAQTRAREIRAKEWVAANYDKWFSARKAACKTMYGTEPVIELLAEYAQAECSRLASRVEQEHRIGELIRADKEAAESRVLELEWGLRNAIHALTSDYLQAGGDLAADANPTLQYRNKLVERLAKLLAGAHAEEKE